MDNPWDQWSPVLVATVMPSRAFRTQPNEGWIESGSSWTSQAAPSDANSGILGQLTQPPGKFAAGPFTEPTRLLGQFLTAAGVAQAIQNRTQTETKARGGRLCYAGSKQV
jgi:hypothetical protein